MEQQRSADWLRRNEQAREIAHGIYDHDDRNLILRIVEDLEELMLLEVQGCGSPENQSDAMEHERRRVLKLL